MGDLDELQTFVGSKKNKIWIWTAVNHFKPGILEWVVGDHSSEKFEPLWAIVSLWRNSVYHPLYDSPFSVSFSGHCLWL